MEWRCEWCGKPHEADDPPCDNCGHGSFEKAIVRQPAAGDSTTVWVCTECGREHPKHAPPCSRCGNAELERRELTVDDAELTAPGYRDLLTPQYVAGLAVALALGGILLLGLAGVIDIPGLESGVPEVRNVPGNATTLDGVSLSAVEGAFVERLNALRTAGNLSDLRRHDRLDAVATFYNRRRVKAMAGEGTLPSPEELRDLVGDRCGPRAVLVDYTVPVPDSVRSADAIGERLASRAVESGQAGFPADRGLTGLDTHALRNGSLSVTQIAC